MKKGAPRTVRAECRQKTKDLRETLPTAIADTPLLCAANPSSSLQEPVVVYTKEQNLHTRIESLEAENIRLKSELKSRKEEKGASQFAIEQIKHDDNLVCF